MVSRSRYSRVVHGLGWPAGWVGLGRECVKKFCFSGLGWVIHGSEMADVRKIHVVYICNFVSSICWQIRFCENLQFDASLHHLSEILRQSSCCSMHGDRLGNGYGLGWVVGYEYGPMDNYSPAPVWAPLLLMKKCFYAQSVPNFPPSLTPPSPEPPCLTWPLWLLLDREAYCQKHWGRVE